MQKESYGIMKKNIINENNPHSNRYYGVQMLRAFAALLVVFSHSTSIISDKMTEGFWKFWIGSAGVDIFFAISGFVILIASSSEDGKPQRWDVFLLRRIIRIVPLYWMLTALKLVMLLYNPSLAQHSSVELWHSISSFLFIPAFNAEGEIVPLLQVGWTLSYEMFFYALFAVTLAFRLRTIIWLTAVLSLLSLVAIWRTDEWGAISGLFRPILLEFIFGMWIAMLTMKGWRMPVKLAYIVVFISVSMIFLTFITSEEIALKYRVIFWGIPGALLLLAAISLEEKFHKFLSGFPNLLGNASYAIYLVHGFVLPLIAMVCIKLGFYGSVFSDYTILLLCMICSTIAGIITHIWIEKPITGYLRKILSKKYE